MTESHAIADAILTRQHVLAAINECLHGRLRNAQLAQWAFDQFYKIETEVLQYEDGQAALLADVLDELMFADESSFQLTEQDLHMLVRRLEP